MVRFVNQKLLAVVLAILGASSAFCVDQQLLSDLGGVYDGKYVSGYYELIESGGTTLPIGKRYQGRLVIPKRKGRKLKGSFVSGAGRLDFSQRVRNIKSNRASAKYRSPLVLTLRKADNPDGLPPFVGAFRVKAVRKEYGEFLNMTFWGVQVVDDGGSVRMFKVQGKFRTRRK